MWLARARDQVGLREIAGAMHEPKILQFARDAHVAWIHDDETAWCATFACAMLERSLITSPRSARARSFEAWGRDMLVRDAGGIRLGSIPLGAIVVFDRPPDPLQGHVGFATGVDPFGMIRVLAGNQRNSVSIMSFHVDRLQAVRWPSEDQTEHAWLPRIPFTSTTAAVSSNEA